MQDKLKSGYPLPRNTAYYKWDDESNCADVWRQYYVMNWKNVLYGNGKGDEAYCKAIEQALVDFSKPISDNKDDSDFVLEGLTVEPRGKEDVLVIQYQDGRKIPFDLLSKGHKRILSIVFDIAHRGYFLQKDRNPYGIVLIDDIEMHLHPSLAKEIIQRLRRLSQMFSL